jgi:acetylornithine/N-succinyldiaminopimelate aminotransferase
MPAVLPVYNSANLAFERGEGAWAITADGERYLDFGSGVAVNALGHAHPRLVAALTGQAQKLWHVSNIYQIPGQERLARRLCDAGFADRVFFCNSGAEAMECSIKMARKYFSHKGEPARWRLIAFEGAFHGRTLATIAAGGQEKHLAGFGPAVEGFDRAPLGDIEAVRALIGEETAGVIYEPVQGEGGVRFPGWSFLRQLRELTRERGVLLILDEVQTGIGRTGKLFAHEWAGIEPDVLAAAKGLGGGFPIGACLASEEAASGMTAGSHGSTFGGNPLAMAVADAVLDVVLEPGFLERIQQNALLLKQRLAEVRDTYPRVIGEIRGEGFLLGMRCEVPAQEMFAALLEQRLLSVGAGENVVRLLPPLIAGEAEIAEAVQKIFAACAQLDAKTRQ